MELENTEVLVKDTAPLAWGQVFGSQSRKDGDGQMLGFEHRYAGLMGGYEQAHHGDRVGLVHGQMKGTDKDAAMEAFQRGETSILVATTVIEVGVDVPNASLMVVEHAERFGLSQLHQLRGRVGRGAVASVCVLLYTGPLSDTGKSRLKAMVETNDGFEIARRDLEIRGPGEFLGARQSGAPLLRFADLATDVELLAWARESAPLMLDRHNALAQRHILRWLGGKADYLKA